MQWHNEENYVLIRNRLFQNTKQGKEVAIKIEYKH